MLNSLLNTTIPHSPQRKSYADMMAARVNQIAQKIEEDEQTDNNTACGCRREKGFTSGWCGVAGFGVPACDH